MNATTQVYGIKNRIFQNSTLLFKRSIPAVISKIATVLHMPSTITRVKKPPRQAIDISFPHLQYMGSARLLAQFIEL